MIHLDDVCGGISLQAVDAVDGQLQGLDQVEGLVPGHQLQALADLGVVEAAVDGREHEACDTAYSMSGFNTRLEAIGNLLEVYFVRLEQGEGLNSCALHELKRTDDASNRLNRQRKRRSKVNKFTSYKKAVKSCPYRL